MPGTHPGCEKCNTCPHAPLLLARRPRLYAGGLPYDVSNNIQGDEMRVLTVLALAAFLRPTATASVNW